MEANKKFKRLIALTIIAWFVFVGTVCISYMAHEPEIICAFTR